MGARLWPWAALAPRRAVVAGREVIEAIVRFDTSHGPGVGAIRLICPPHGAALAWTISTTLDFNGICDARSKSHAPVSHPRDFSSRDWLAERQAEIAFADREPDVLIVGGGHAGISAAVELKRIGLDALVIDKAARVGDNWRLRYHGLKLHNKTPVNHLRYLPFPPTFPDYIPKDKIANWLESYVDVMEIDFWTGTTFEDATYDETSRRWIWSRPPVSTSWSRRSSSPGGSQYRTAARRRCRCRSSEARDEHMPGNNVGLGIVGSGARSHGSDNLAVIEDPAANCAVPVAQDGSRTPPRLREPRSAEKSRHSTFWTKNCRPNRQPYFPQSSW
jgi:hypothetical protein